MSRLGKRAAVVKAAVWAALALTAPALAGCGGFTPLYAAPGVAPKLSAIEVVQPDGRTGFLLRQYLNDSFARDRSQPPVYRLTLGSRELRIPRGIRVDNVASRYEVDLYLNYTLTEIATSQVVTRGQILVNVTYDSADQPYAAVAAQQDSQRRVAEQAAERLRIELASFFASPRPTPAASTLVAPNLSTYSERLPAATVESPRARATGEPVPQGGQSDTFGQTRQTTVPPGTEPSQPFSPSQDPNAIQTLPEAGGTGQ